MSPKNGSLPFLLIDGQQRLTTTFILLTCSATPHAARDGKSSPMNRADPPREPVQEGGRSVKLLPTQADRPAFLQLVQERDDPSGRIGAAYSFLDRKLRTEGIDIEFLKGIVVERLAVVSITLGSDDILTWCSRASTRRGSGSRRRTSFGILLLKIHTDQQMACTPNTGCPCRNRWGLS